MPDRKRRSTWRASGNRTTASRGQLRKTTFKSRLADYVRLYAFLSQIVTFTDADLEKLYVYSRLLRRRQMRGGCRSR